MILKKFKFLSLLLIVAAVTASCGAPAQAEVDISTAVAQTVQAQNSLTKVSALPTLTPAPSLPAAATPEVSPTNTSAPASNPGCVVSAELIGENPPDNTLLSPGEYFYKTWTFLNTGTCIWTTAYNLVFWSGDRMGGLSSYPLTEDVAPEGTFNITIYLQAPTTEGTATGYWRFKTPWGVDFGVGSQSTSFYAQIKVATDLTYGITNVTYSIQRDPLEGCPLNVRYTVYATVTSNGPTTFEYYWDQSDGNESGVKKSEITEAGTKTFKREWLISLNDNPVQRWIKFVVTKPVPLDFGEAIIDHKCLNK